MPVRLAMGPQSAGGKALPTAALVASTAGLRLKHKAGAVAKRNQAMSLAGVPSVGAPVGA